MSELSYSYSEMIGNATTTMQHNESKRLSQASYLKQQQNTTLLTRTATNHN